LRRPWWSTCGAAAALRDERAQGAFAGRIGSHRTANRPGTALLVAQAPAGRLCVHVLHQALALAAQRLRMLRLPERLVAALQLGLAHRKLLGQAGVEPFRSSSCWDLNPS
jgi:hypothetical protein